MRLARKFFARGAEEVARDLLGKILVRRFGPTSSRLAGLRGVKEARVIITETEAYLGEYDLASHARFGRTKRTEAMYGKAGRVYMFFVYGVHWMLNIVCGEVGDPQAVLIRGADVTSDTAQVTRISGPGRVAKYLELDGSFYGEDLITSSRLWVEGSGKGGSDGEIVVTPRVGVGYAKDWKDRQLRFVLEKVV